MGLIRNFIYKTETIATQHVKGFYCLKSGDKIRVNVPNEKDITRYVCKVESVEKNIIHGSIKGLNDNLTIENIYLGDV